MQTSPAFPDIPHPDIPPEKFKRLSQEAKLAEEFQRPSTSYRQDVWQRFKKNKLAMAGLCFILLITLAAIFGPMLSPYTYDGMDRTSGNQWPNAKHWFGTDKFGRDIFVRVLYGARISLTVGFSAAAISLIIGIVYGSVSGYLGGRVDMVMMRIVDILIGLPSLLYIVLLMLVLGANLFSVILAICISSWIGTARIVRGQVLTLKSSEYVMSAKLAGASNWWILFYHLLPNSMGPIIVCTAFLVPGAIFNEAFLSFLGIGISVPMASWGTLANEAISQMSSRPYQLWFPVGAICLTMFSLNFIGDGLRDSLDPKLKK
jgi:oligopeptide transport system permease protein